MDLLVPQTDDLTLQDHAICWPDPQRYKNYRKRPVPKDLLDRFLKLRDRSETRVLEFARQYGTLNLCSRHQLPLGHSQDWDCSPSGHEPVEQWCGFAKQAYCILQIRDALKEPRAPTAAEWLLALGMAEGDAGVWSWAGRVRRGTDLRRFKRFGYRELGVCVQAWLDAAQIKPTIFWDSQYSQFQIELRPANYGFPNLFTELAWQLIHAVTGKEKLQICAGCGEPFVPGRKKPGKDRRSFCRKCGLKAKNRQAQQRFRDKLQRLREGKAGKHDGKGRSTTSKKTRAR